MRRGLVPLIALSALACQGPAPPAAKRDAAVADAARPDAALKARRGRRKIRLPEPEPPPPPPEGTPQSPEDLARLSQAAGEGNPIKKPGAPPVQRLDAFRARVGAVLVDRRTRRVEIPARFNQHEGILEYYACASQGKLHESVLEVLGEPSHIHLALLLAGFEPTVYRTDEKKGMVPVKLGGPLKLSVEWKDAKSGAARHADASAWLYDRHRKKAPAPLHWIFQGSYFYRGRYVAEDGRSVVGLIPDETAVIGVEDDAGNPYRGEMQGYEVFARVAPPIDTPVTLVIEAGEPRAQPPGSPP